MPATVSDTIDAAAKERAVLCGLSSPVFDRDENATEETMQELSLLAETAGAVPICTLLQTRETPDPHSFLGSGKVEELKNIAAAYSADIILFDNSLSPSQTAVLRDATGLPVLDRSALILDIFAKRAKTKEGRLQVALAQYLYLLPRLDGLGTSLSRQGGGIGTRGPGETKLETDRRHIRSRISQLRAQLAEVSRTRDVQRQMREKSKIPVVALVGYTNAGKSSLLNALTDAGIPANNRLFDTLDTTTRRFYVTDTLEILLSDTVGFIEKLPHHLIEAFQATLTELRYADLILHVIDASDPELDRHIEVTDKLLVEIALPETPRIEVYNKLDLCPDLPSLHSENQIAVSATNGDHLDDLRSLIADILMRSRKTLSICIPYAEGNLIGPLHQEAQILSEEYQEDGIHLQVKLPQHLESRYTVYEIKNGN